MIYNILNLIGLILLGVGSFFVQLLCMLLCILVLPILCIFGVIIECVEAGEEAKTWLFPKASKWDFPVAKNAADTAHLLKDEVNEE